MDSAKNSGNDLFNFFDLKECVKQYTIFARSEEGKRYEERIEKLVKELIEIHYDLSQKWEMISGVSYSKEEKIASSIVSAIEAVLMIGFSVYGYQAVQKALNMFIRKVLDPTMHLQMLLWREIISDIEEEVEAEERGSFTI